ncbi:MAG: hypothetical protein FJ265_07620 [Planctomycetes bacterium]|nr:hypothetical protein [Planctomycetota bacterium]
MTGRRQCGPAPGASAPARGDCYANMCTPPRTCVVSRQLPVSGRALIFCTELACIHHGLLPGPTRQTANGAAAERWGTDVSGFLAELRRRRLGLAGPARALAAWPGPVIGWSPLAPKPDEPWRTDVCTDVAWTVAVLARVEGLVLLPRRRAHLSWRHLFGEPFAVDDARLAAVAGVPRERIGAAPAAGAKP